MTLERTHLFIQKKYFEEKQFTLQPFVGIISEVKFRALWQALDETSERKKNKLR